MPTINACSAVRTLDAKLAIGRVSMTSHSAIAKNMLPKLIMSPSTRAVHEAMNFPVSNSCNVASTSLMSFSSRVSGPKNLSIARSIGLTSKATAKPTMMTPTKLSTRNALTLVQISAALPILAPPPCLRQLILESPRERNYRDHGAGGYWHFFVTIPLEQLINFCICSIFFNCRDNQSSGPPRFFCARISLISRHVVDCRVEKPSQHVAYCCDYRYMRGYSSFQLVHCDKPKGSCDNMGTIVSRKRKNGSTGHMAKIRITRDGIEYKESMTFERKAAASAWIAKREEELNQPGALVASQRPQGSLADAIDKYIETSLKAIGRTKAQVLASIKTYRIARMACGDIRSTHIVELADELLAGGRKPQTVGNYMSHLQSVFAIAKPAWGYELDEGEMKAAFRVLKRLGKVSSSNKRDRRPTVEELNKIMALYQSRQDQRDEMAPMTHIIAFSIFSTRRQEETTRIKWTDLDETNKRVLVRDMKNPGEKKGNDVWCDLPEPAWNIIQAMPRVAEEIFPFNADAISASFTRACKLLEIEDLHFHDLRHDGVSRLFELDYGIARAATVSGHRSWTSLKRYTHIAQRGDKYTNWPWLVVVFQPASVKPRPPSRRSPKMKPEHVLQVA